MTCTKAKLRAEGSDKQLRPASWLRTALPIVLVSSLVLAAENGSQWQVSVVDSGVGGKFSSLRIDSYGNAHVAHHEESESLIQYSFWDHKLNKWFTTTLDKGSGFCSLALDSKQRPHISYIEYGTSKVKYAYWDGSTWKKQAIGLQGRTLSYYTSITLDNEDRPRISFYTEHSAGYDRLRLRVLAWNGRFWELRTVDGDEGSGKFNSIATDSAGHPHVAYGNVEYKNVSLRYAHWNGESWEKEVLYGAGSPGSSMWSVSMVLDKSDVPHVAFTDVPRRLVKYATRRSEGWEFQVVDGLGKVGYPDRNGIALDDYGNPYISYYDAGRGLLKVAHQEDAKWISEVVDGNGAGFTSSLQIDQDTIWVTYADETGARLKFARRPLQQDHSPNQAKFGAMRK